MPRAITIKKKKRSSRNHALATAKEPATKPNGAAAAAGETTLPKDAMIEISYTSSGQLFMRGITPYNPDDLVGKKGLTIYKRMMTDDQVKAGVRVKQNAVLSTGYEIQPPQVEKDSGDEEIAEEQRKFIEFNFGEMEGSFDSKLLEIMSAIWAGFSVSEKLFYSIDFGPFAGKIGLKALKTREPYSFDFDTDAHGNLKDNGVWQDKSLKMPKDKFLIYSYQKQFDNFYGECFSSDTEILTEKGWRLVSEVGRTDRLATLNPKTNELEYREPTRTYSFPYKGKMFHQGGKLVDLLVTPNHQMWVKTENTDRFRFIEARNLPRYVGYKRDAIWNGRDEKWFTLPAVKQATGTGEDVVIASERKIPMDNWLSFFGIWLAEGSAFEDVHHRTYSGKDISYSYPVVVISQNYGPRLDQIKAWVDNCGFEYKENATGLTKKVCNLTIRNDIALHAYLKRFGNSATKSIPAEIKSLSKRQLEILYNAMAFGDAASNGSEYATVSRQLADDVAEILFKMGRAVTIYPRKKPNGFPSKKTLWLIWNTKRNSIGNARVNKKDARAWVDYEGQVHCVNVPNHLVYVRRNGKACWSGNSDLRAAYRGYWNKDNTLRFMMIAMERYGEPIAVFTSTGNVTAAQAAQVRAFAQNLQNRSSIVLPNGLTVDFHNPDPKAAGVFIPAIQMHNTEIRIALLMPGLIGLSGEQAVGSLARAMQEFDVFILIVEQIRRELETLINEGIIKFLIDLNYDVLEGKYPRFKFKEITAEARKQLFEMWLKAVGEEAIERTFDDVNRMRETMGLAPLSEDDWNLLERERKDRERGDLDYRVYRVQTAVDMGLDVGEDYLYSLLEIPKPGPGEEILMPPIQPGFGGDGTDPSANDSNLTAFNFFPLGKTNYLSFEHRA